MTFLWDGADAGDEDDRPEGRESGRTALRSRRGLAQVVVGGAGWVLVLPLLWLTRDSPLVGAYLSLPIWLGAVLLAVLVSTVAVLVAGVRRSWGVAVVSFVVAAAGVVAVPRPLSPTEYVDRQYRAHRTALAALARDYRAGRLDGTGTLTLPDGVRDLSPSGFAYAGPTALFVQMWQNWRAESGTGLAYFLQPPAADTSITTAEGDLGQPRREVGDGWWWVA